jgi:PAS domain S-box-containing protein
MSLTSRSCRRLRSGCPTERTLWRYSNRAVGVVVVRSGLVVWVVRVMAEGVLGDRSPVGAGDGSVDELVASALVEAAPDGMLMADEQGRILLVNRQVEVLFGYRRQDLVGQPVEVLLPERLRKVHGAHRTRFRAEPRTRTMGAGLRLWGRRADGAEFPVEISLSPLRTDGGLRVIAAVRDITARVAAETEAAHVRSVVDATRDAVLMFERDSLRFTYVNQGAISQLGYHRDELLAMGPLHIKPMFSEDQFRALIDSLSPGQSHCYTTVHRRKDGTDLPVEAVLQRPSDDYGGSSTWMVSIARDLTARLEMERRAQAAEREVAVLEDRERIARDLHDRVIQRLFAAGLGIEALRARVRDPLLTERLTRAVDELDDTIRELRSSIFQLTSSSLSQSRRAMILDVCVDERAALGFDPRVRFDGPVDTISNDVGDHLLAVLREAMSNIAHHARATTVEVTVAAGAHNLVLRVEDNGIGLPAQAAQGGGNGLANMAARARKLDGTCQLTPASPSGTILEWRIPLA